jgi:hypothetical protein
MVINLSLLLVWCGPRSPKNVLMRPAKPWMSLMRPLSQFEFETPGINDYISSLTVLTILQILQRASQISFFQTYTSRNIQSVLSLSNGHSPANLENSSTRQKFAVFLWLAPANLASIERIFVTRAGEFGEFCEFGKFGEFGEGRLDRFIHKNIFFFVYKTT